MVAGPIGVRLLFKNILRHKIKLRFKNGALNFNKAHEFLRLFEYLRFELRYNIFLIDFSQRMSFRSVLAILRRTAYVNYVF